MIPNKAIPSQHEVDLTNPEEHLIWALRSLPMIGDSGMMTASPILRKWSKHLWDCGFRHRDYLVSLADVDGKIDVGQLPEQTVKFQEAFRGPHHSYNPAGRWVGPDAAPVKPYAIPDIREMTIQEKHVLAYQLAADGVKLPTAPKPVVAKVEGT